MATLDRTETEKSAEELEREAAATRAEIRHTIEELEQRLTPGQLVDQAMSYLRGSGTSTFFSNLGRSVRDNPMPVALIGTGIAWLAVSDRGRNGGGEPLFRPGYLDYGEGQGGHEHDEPSRLRQAREGVQSAAASARDTAHEVGERVRQAGDRVRSAGERVRASGSHARERAREGAERARQGAVRAREGFSHMLDEQPFLIGLAAFAAGALLGGVAPRTQREDELVGELSDELKHEAARVGRETAEQARERAQRVVEAAAHAGEGSEPGGEHARDPRDEREQPGREHRPPPPPS